MAGQTVVSLEHALYLQLYMIPKYSVRSSQPITDLPLAKFQKKFRIESARAQWWNDACSGAFYITICSKDCYHFFGEINK
jgi:hypothetical protein